MLAGVVERANLTQCLKRNDFICHQKVAGEKLTKSAAQTDTGGLFHACD